MKKAEDGYAVLSKTLLKYQKWENRENRGYAFWKRTG